MAQGAGEQGAGGVREDEEARGGEEAEGHEPEEDREREEEGRAEESGDPREGVVRLVVGLPGRGGEVEEE